MMKHLRIAIFFLIVYLNGQTVDNPIYNNNPNNFKSDGIHTEYFDSGEVRAINTYQFNKLNGEAKSYYKNGKLQSHGRYKNNKKKGFWIHHYASGGIKSKENYRYGKLRGYFKSYYENGQVQIDGNFIDIEQQNGLWLFYSDSGDLMEEHLYKKGILVSKTTYKNDDELSIEREKLFQKYQPLLRPFFW